MPNSRREMVFVIVAAVSLAALPGRSSAISLYAVTASDGVTTVSAGYRSVIDSLDSMSQVGLNNLFRPRNPAFDARTSPLTVNIVARGLPLNFQADPNSPSITMTIPAIHFTGKFDGPTRDDSLKAIRDWFKKNGGRLLGELARKNAELSPVDPLAGNPNSAQARTVSTSFDRGFGRLASLSEASAGKEAGQESPKNSNMVSVGARYRAGFGDYGSGSYTLPLGYSWRFDDDVRHQISFDVPFTYQSVEGGHVYSLGVGLGYSHPINDLWVLTAGVDYGLAESKDLGANGHVITGTLTSLLTVPLTRWLLVHIGNMVGQSDSLSMSSGDFASDPGIKNTVIKNGLMLYFPTAGLLRSSGVELFATDTRYFGTKLYDSGYTEIGTSFGFSRVSLEGGKRYDSMLRIGVTGLIARGNNGITLNTGYSF